MSMSGLNHFEFTWAPPRLSNLIERPRWFGAGKVMGRNILQMQNSNSFVKQKNEFGCIAWNCVKRAAGFPCGGAHHSSHAVCFPLQRPQYEQHQSTTLESPAQPPLPRGVVSIAVVVMRPVNIVRILPFPFHYCVCLPHLWEPDKTRQKKPVSTNNFGTWGNT